MPTEYDPLLGKLIAWGRDRAEAIARLQRALSEYTVTGIRTNANLIGEILRDPEFVSGEIFTRWLDERLPQLLANDENPAEADSGAEDAAIIAALLHHLETNAASNSSPLVGNRNTELESLWKRQARLDQTGRGE